MSVTVDLKNWTAIATGTAPTQEITVPFFRPAIDEEEVAEVVAVLRSGWLTTGPMVRRFEHEFATAVGAKNAIALNSCTAALHLAIEALGTKPGDGVLVPTMTFAATSEVLRYLGAVPILVDCDPITGNINLDDAEKKLTQLRAGKLPQSLAPDMKVVGILPVHVGGLMVDIGQLHGFADRHGLWIVEDAAHAFPAAWRAGQQSAWRHCGNGTSAIACFSFYANKTITTGEGGMAVCDDPELGDRIRMMSLHGLSHDAWGRYSGKGAWDYRIIAPGYKYNLADPLAAIGVHQLAKAEKMRQQRKMIADFYFQELDGTEAIELPPAGTDRIHSWHLFPIKLHASTLSISRNRFMELLKERGVGCSVHWRPLHLHPYYEEMFGWCPQHLPIATAQWERLISLPIFPSMKSSECEHVVNIVKDIVAQYAK